MQDLQTGELKELPETFRGLVDDEQQRSKDVIIPQRERQGPVFGVGETVLLADETGNVGKFRIHAITNKRLYLDSVPLNSK